MEFKKPNYPACVITVLIVLSFGLFTICQVYLLKDNYPVTKIWVGSDYICFYNATQKLIHGGSLYKNEWHSMPDYINNLFVSNKIFRWDKEHPWYCFPPLLAYINYPLVYYFDMDTASRLMFFLLFIAVLCGYALINRSFESIGGTDKNIIFLCGVIIIVLSSPVYFLIVRGHMVGIVFLLLALGIYLFQKDNSLCSACFGLSIGMMVFPVLLLVPLLLFRRYKIIVFTFLSLALLVLFCPGLWLEYLKGPLMGRFLESGYFTIVDNASLANTCNFLMTFINIVLSRTGLPSVSVQYYNEAAFMIYALMFCAMALADIKIWNKYGPLDREIETSLIMMYFPFMIAIPKNSYQYNLVLLIFLVPVLCSLLQKLKRPVPVIILWTFMTGIFLGQMQAQFMQNLIDIKHSFFFFSQAFGLFLVMLACVSFKLWFLKKGYSVKSSMKTGEQYETTETPERYSVTSQKVSIHV